MSQRGTSGAVSGFCIIVGLRVPSKCEHLDARELSFSQANIFAFATGKIRYRTEHDGSRHGQLNRQCRKAERTTNCTTQRGKNLMPRVRRSKSTLLVHGGNGQAQGRLQSVTCSVTDTPGDRIGEHIHGMFDRLSDKVREFDGKLELSRTSIASLRARRSSASSFIVFLTLNWRHNDFPDNLPRPVGRKSVAGLLCSSNSTSDFCGDSAV